jgi:hypothetical protein
MGSPNNAGAERFDRVWCVEWEFPANLGGRLPTGVVDTVSEVAAGLGVLLTDAHTDSHDDGDGGDSDLQVWRFYLRVPDVGQPAAPARPVDADTDTWVMPATAWPAAVMTMAGLVAGLAADHGLTGRIRVDFSPTLTSLEAMADLVRAAYPAQLAALEVAFSPYQDRYATATGRRLPATLVTAHPNPDHTGVIGSAAFYVGEEQSRWRVVHAGLATPHQPGTTPDPTDPAPAARGTEHPVLPIPSPNSLLDAADSAGVADDPPWQLVATDGFRATGPLPDAIAEILAHLDGLPITPGTSSV